MGGVKQGMFLSVTTLAALTCQGCHMIPGATGQQAVLYEDVTRYESRAPAVSPRSGTASLAGNDRVPAIQANPDFSLTRAQTETTPSISITPVIGRDGLDADVDSQRDLSKLSLSNATAVVDFEGARKSAHVISPVRAVKAFDASVALSAANAQTGFGFDVGVVPRVSIRQDGRFKTRRVGGEIRIGQNFDQRGKAVDTKSWYLFAGADGEALVYEPYRERGFTESMALRDQVTVGDMQAGLSFTRGNGQLSISYIRREVEYSERGVRGEEDEDFAGVSFTLRR